MLKNSTPETESQTETFLIQTDAPAKAAVRFTDGASGLEKITAQDFDKMTQLVERAGASFVQRVQQMAGHPTSCEIEFGVSIGAEGGVPFLTKGTLESNFKVTVKWETGR